MNLGEKLRYLREVEGTLRGIRATLSASEPPAPDKEFERHEARARDALREQLPRHDVAVVLGFGEQNDIAGFKILCAPRAGDEVDGFARPARPDDFIGAASTRSGFEDQASVAELEASTGVVVQYESLGRAQGVDRIAAS